MSKAGVYIQNLSGDAAYQSFRPSPLPPEIKIDSEMMRLLIEANKNLVCSQRGFDLLSN